MDNFLIFIDGDPHEFKNNADNSLALFRNLFNPLELTCELPDEGRLRFLDVLFLINRDHICWMYQPRGKKPLLFFSSAHSKLVKRAIVNLSLINTLERTCPHKLSKALGQQVKRLVAAGYPDHVIVAVAESMRKTFRACNKKNHEPEKGKKEKVAVIPYIQEHRIT